VADVNDAPQITSAPVTTATEDLPYSYDVDATDPDGDPLTCSLDVSPAGMTIVALTGLVQWTPDSSQVGPNSVTVRVTDAGLLFDTQAFVVAVASAVELDISVFPATVGFGQVTVGGSSDQIVTITNVGSGRERSTDDELSVFGPCPHSAVHHRPRRFPGCHCALQPHGSRCPEWHPGCH